MGEAALACQPYANISIDSREIPLSIFLLTVAEFRKSINMVLHKLDKPLLL
jgi:hypothetical protein